MSYRDFSPDGMQKGYKGANIKFEEVFQKNERKTLESGKLEGDTYHVVTIQWPGQEPSSSRVEDRHLADPDVGPKYKAWCESRELPAEGTPLAHWPVLSKTEVEQLCYIGIKTVEQLAAVSDDVKRKLGPQSVLVKQAQSWLDAANSKQSDVTKYKAQLDKLQARYNKLEEQFELMLQRLEASEGTRLRNVSINGG